MATNNIAVSSTSVQSDTNATANTLVQRDASSGIYGNIVSSTALQTSGTLAGKVTSQTASFTAGAATDYVIDATAAAVAVTLPLASSNPGVTYHFLKKDAVTANAMTFTSASTIVGVVSYTAQWSHPRVVSDGTSWFIA